MAKKSRVAARRKRFVGNRNGCLLLITAKFGQTQRTVDNGDSARPKQELKP
jgi:hypothetical protein